jgi:small subunit ribosomal protein S20
MPNIESAAKRMRQAARRQAANRAVRTKIMSYRRRFLEAVAGGDKTKSQEAFRQFCSVVDKARKRGVIKDNNADRKKSRAAARLATLKAEPAASK